MRPQSNIQSGKNKNVQKGNKNQPRIQVDLVLRISATSQADDLFQLSALKMLNKRGEYTMYLVSRQHYTTTKQFDQHHNDNMHKLTHTKNTPQDYTFHKQIMATLTSTNHTYLCPYRVVHGTYGTLPMAPPHSPLSLH